MRTLADLHRNSDPKWVWAYCGNWKCGHSKPVAIAPFVIRYGPDAPADTLKRKLKCSVCGHVGAETRLPGWGDIVVGWQPFPAHLLEAVPRASIGDGGL